jgi:hypothetical protein
MKKYFIILAVPAITLFACNSKTNNAHDGHDMNSMAKDSVMPVTTMEEQNIRTIQVAYTNLDPGAVASIKTMVDHYLQIKNALANDNGMEAASGAKAMSEAMKSLDKSLLNAEQKTAYDKIEDDLKEHAVHIAKNGDKIDHQRSHFSMMSEDVYELVKNFGAGRPMYHDHCPMAKENQGAMWMSENKEIKNPYFGPKMPTCGTVEEVIK